MTALKLSRRSWLRLAATSALMPLFFGEDGTPTRVRVANADTGGSPLRLILLMQHNGVSRHRFWPDANGVSEILHPLIGDDRLRPKTTIVKGVRNDDRGAGNQHDWGFAGLWSGRRTIGTFGDPWGAGPSIDQMLAKEITPRVPWPTLNAGVLASDVPRFKEHRFSFSYLGARQPIPTETDPLRLFSRMFAPAQDPAFAARRSLQQKSVLDHGARDLARLRARLGKEERDKLDIHATSIREYEQRLSYLANTSAACSGGTIPSLQNLPPQIDVTSEENVPALMPAMLDLVALSIACRLTQIVTFPMGAGGEKWSYRWLGIGKNSHDEIAHKDDGNDVITTEYMVQIGRWQCEHVARLAKALDAIPEGNGTVLDNTLIVWGNEMASGQHHMEGIPIVFIGGANAKLANSALYKRPAGIIDAGWQDYHRVGTSVMQMMGVNANGFGEAPTCGPLKGLNLG